MPLLAAKPQTFRYGNGWARLGPWRGGEGGAHLVVAPDVPLGPAAVAQCVARARRAGYQVVYTSALRPEEQRAFLDDGFVVHERLHLLVRSLDQAPPPVELRCRTARRRTRTAVIALDDASFSPFWRLGRSGLRDALTATPYRAFRVVRGDATGSAGLAGYAITGRAGHTGYLQRIAVDPSARRHGVGRALVDDGLGWLWSHGCREAWVNTQIENHAAVALYERAGFHRHPDGLAVLVRDL